MRIWGLIFTILMVFGTTACASLVTHLPEVPEKAVSNEKATQARAALDKYIKHNARLQKIARPILTANASLCLKQRNDIGVQTLKKKSFPKDLREIAAKQGGFDAEPQILYIHDQKSNLKIGDRLYRDTKPINGYKIAKGDKIEVVRNEEKVDVSMPQPVSICDYPVGLRFTPAINAFATGKAIYVTTGMMDFATDNELALILGHELAHNTHSHIRKIIQNRILLLGFAHETRKFESEADYVGLYYMARAGYDIAHAESFWRKLATVSIKSLNKPKSHPITPERFARLAVAIEEIEGKIARGEKLEATLK